MSNSSSPKKTNSINNLKQKQDSLIKSTTAEENDNKKGKKGSYAKEYNKYLKSSFDKSHNSSTNNLSGKTLVETVSSIQNSSILNTSSSKQSKSAKLKPAHSLGALETRNTKRSKDLNNKYKDLCCTHKYARMYGINYTSHMKNVKSPEENLSSCKSNGELIPLDSISPCVKVEEAYIPPESAVQSKDPCTNSGNQFNSDINHGDSNNELPNPIEIPNFPKPNLKRSKYLISTISLSIDCLGHNSSHYNNFNSNKETSQRNYVIDSCVNIHLNEDQVSRDNISFTDCMQESKDQEEILGNITEVNETEENDNKDHGTDSHFRSCEKERGVSKEDIITFRKNNIFEVPDRKTQSCVCLLKIEGNRMMKDSKCSFTVQEVDKFNLPSNNLNKSNKNRIFNPYKRDYNQQGIHNKLCSLSPRYSVQINYENEKINFRLMCEQVVRGRKKTKKRRTIAITNASYNKSKNSLLHLIENNLIATSRIGTYRLEKINMVFNSDLTEVKKIPKEDLDSFVLFNDMLKEVYEYEMDINEKIRLFNLCKEDKFLLEELKGNRKETDEGNLLIYKKNVHVKGYRNSKSIQGKENELLNEKITQDHPYVKQRLHYSMTKEKFKKNDDLFDRNSDNAQSRSNLFKSSQTSLKKEEIVDSQFPYTEHNQIVRNRSVNQALHANEQYLTKMTTTFQSIVEKEFDKYSKDFFFTTSSTSNLLSRNDENRVKKDDLEGYTMRILNSRYQEDIREKYRNIRSSNIEKDKIQGVFKMEGKNKEINKYRSIVYPANDSKYKSSQMITSSKLFK